MMSVSLTNEVRLAAPHCMPSSLIQIPKGPVTFTLDSRKFEYVDQQEGSAGSSGKPAKCTKQLSAEQETIPPLTVADQ